MGCVRCYMGGGGCMYCCMGCCVGCYMGFVALVPLFEPSVASAAFVRLTEHSTLRAVWSRL